MIGNISTQPQPLVAIGRQVQVRWNIERKDYTNEDGAVVESWNYEYANIDSQDKEKIVEGIVRSRYSQHKAESLIAKQLSGDDTGEYAAYLRYLKLAEAVAEGKYLKSELADFDTAVVGDVILEIVTALNDKGIIP